MTGHGLAREAGITYRQLDYWARCGYVRPDHEGGSGNRRVWPDLEVRITLLIGRLIDAGLRLPAAAEIARGAATAGDDVCSMLAPGVMLIISDDVGRRHVENTLPL